MIDSVIDIELGQRERDNFTQQSLSNLITLKPHSEGFWPEASQLASMRIH